MLVPTLLALPIVALAARSDYREREVNNIMLFPLFLLGVCAVTFRVAVAAGAGAPLGVFADMGLHLALGCLAALAPWLAGGYGGADAKAMLALALVYGDVWAVLWTLTAAAVLVGVYYGARHLLEHRDRTEPVSAPFLVGVFVGAVSLVPALL